MTNRAIEDSFQNTVAGYKTVITSPCAIPVPNITPLVTWNIIVHPYTGMPGTSPAPIPLPFVPDAKVLETISLSFDQESLYSGFYDIDIYPPISAGDIGSNFKLAAARPANQVVPNFPYTVWQYNLAKQSPDFTDHIHFHLVSSCLPYLGGNPHSKACQNYFTGAPTAPNPNLVLAVYQSGD